MKKKPFMSKKQWLNAILLSFGMLFLTFTVVYLQNNVKISCEDGSIEKYLKTELHKQKTICGGVNIYKYNQNEGLGAYFMNQTAVDLVLEEERMKEQVLFLDLK